MPYYKNSNCINALTYILQSEVMEVGEFIKAEKIWSHLSPETCI
jgi:hypothetical protein